MTNPRTRPSKARATDARKAVPSGAPGRRRMDIELLRVLAITGVVLFHFAPTDSLAPQGFLGVDVFFVISGFVITGQMLRLHERGALAYSSFLASRIRRLLPSAVLVICVTFLVILFWGNPITAQTEAAAAASALVYIANFYFADQAVDYFAQGQESAFLHFWSLSVEEQFYVFWPLAFGVIVRIARQRRIPLSGTALAVGGALCVVSFIGATIAMADDPARAFFMPWWRLSQLMVGALLAVLAHQGWLDNLRPSPTRGGAIQVARVVCLALIVVIMVQEVVLIPGPGLRSLLITAPVAFILATGPTDTDLLARWGTLRPLAWLAAASYAIYLWHWPIWLLMDGRFEADVADVLAATALTLALAATSRRWVEEPLHRGARSRSLPNVRVIISGLGASLAIAVLIATVGPPIAAARVGDWAARLSPSLSDAPQDRARAFTDGCFAPYNSKAFEPCISNPEGARTIVLAGDSHAAQWQEAIEDVAARAGEPVRLVTATRAGCPVWDVRSVWGEEAADACDTWRADLLRSIERDKPEVVVVTMDQGSPFIGNLDGALSTTEAQALLQDGVRRTLESITRNAGTVIVLEDTPASRTNPMTCLATARLPTDCAFDAAPDSVGRTTTQAAASSVPGVKLVDPYPLACPAARCQVVIGDKVAYSDGGHLSNSYAKTLAPWIATWLEPALTPEESTASG